MDHADVARAPLAGDVILLNGGAKLSRLSRLYQRLVRPEATPYSHVALNYSGGTLIHAVPGGVDVVCSSDVFRSGAYKADWRAMRHVEIERRIVADEKYEDLIRWHAAYFFQQRYNFFVNLTRSWRGKLDSRSFCSELVAKVYRELGFPFSRSPEKTLPVDIAAATVTSDWKDVSKIYRPVTIGEDVLEQIAGMLPPEIVALTGQTPEQFAAVLVGNDDSLERSQTELTRQQLALFRTSARDIVQSNRMIGAVKGFLRKMGVNDERSAPPSEPQLPNIFWDTPDQEKDAAKKDPRTNAMRDL